MSLDTRSSAMRGAAVWLMASVVAMLASGACKSADDPQPPILGGGAGAGGGAGGVVVPLDGAIPPGHDARSPIDSRRDDADTPEPDAALPPDARDAAVSTDARALRQCDLLNQDCSNPSHGCYLTARGGTVCRSVSLSAVGEGARCTPGEDDPCDKKLICAPGADVTFCRSICSVTGKCVGGATCVPLAGFEPVGTCQF